MFRLLLQLLGLLLLLLGATVVTLKVKYRGADGPSILFPGGALTSGRLHRGADPDWQFTDDQFVIELQTTDPVSSRRIFVMESDGRLYVPSGYMRSFLGRLWKDWAFQVDAGSKNAVARIDGVRYERTLVRVEDPTIVDGIARKMAAKYGGGATAEAVAEIKQSVAAGDTWLFELAPRSADP